MSAPTYQPPENAKSPADSVQIDRILLDGGEGDVSIARGAWEGVPCLLMRWNGRPEQPLGYPSRFDNMMWLVVPQWMNSAVLDAVKTRMTSDLKAALRDVPKGGQK